MPPTLPTHLLSPCRPSRLRAGIAGAASAAALAFACTALLQAGIALAAPSDAATGKGGAAQAGPSLLPGFEGTTLDGKSLSTASFPGQRLLLFCFNPGVEMARVYAQALARLAPERTRHNFAIAGVAMGLDPAKARDFAAAQKLDFPIFDDSDGQIGAGLGLRSPLALVGSDADRRVGLALVGFEHEDLQSVDAVEARVREYLRIPAAGAVADGKLDGGPMAPVFEAELLDGGGRFRLADMAGKPVVLTFFLSSCPHCQEALRFFRGELARLPEKVRPVLVGVAADSSAYTVQSTLREKKLDFFPVLLDRDRKIATAYASFGGVPDILLLDAAGRIVHRDMGWNDKYDANLMRMRLARLAGTEVPMLLERDGYSGNEACAVCHPAEAATWRLTGHAFAFDTLVTRSADRDPKCVGCHVVGFGERGGYSEAGREKHLENVGCESCHGRGGGHLAARAGAAAAKSPTDYRAACAACHDAKHSFGFDYASFLPRVSHAAIASLSDAERARLVTDRERPRDLLPKTSAFVGSTVCRNCHAREHGIWLRSAHSRAVDSLRKKDEEGNHQCLPCHVTGYGHPGGFPDGGKVRSHLEMARVGCESCHGPGAEHVRAGGKQPAGVVRLGDKCDSCVVLQICGSCHDDANDPGFRFRVVRKIEYLRHGAAPKADAPEHR